MLRALAALPRQVAAVVRPSPSATWSSPGPIPPPEGGRTGRLESAMIGLLTAVGATFAALVLVFALARDLLPVLGGRRFEGLVGPFLGRPSPVGATLAHWLVAVVSIVVAYGVILVIQPMTGSSLIHSGVAGASARWVDLAPVQATLAERAERHGTE